jgi:hypothetical protein
MGLFGLLGSIAITIALMVLGLLSKRLGSVTRTPHYYIWFYFATGLMLVSILARLVNLGHDAAFGATLVNDEISVLLYAGLPAIALTLGVVVAWRYWSWLLAERN